MQYLKIILLVTIGIAIVFSNVYAQNDIASPLKQLKSGIPVQDVKCREGFVLVIKESNDQPSCIRPASEQRLLAHGWIVPKLETMQTNHDETAGMTHQNVTSTENGSNYTPTDTTQYQNITPLSNDTSKATINITEQNNTTSLNDTSKATVTSDTNNTNDLGNGTITETMINKLYNDWHTGMDTGVTGQIPLPSIQVTPTISSTNPNSIKILLIGMSPNPLKVGDIPQFTLTYQNISNKPIYVEAGTGVTPLGMTISPSDKVVVGFPTEHLAQRGAGPVLINPNQIDTDYASACTICENLDLSTMPSNLDFGGGFYQIMKPGTLHVTMKLVLRHELTGKYDQMETIQFNINATQ